MDIRQENELTGGGECYLHNHPEDRVPTHDTLNRLQELAVVKTKTANYTLSYDDDWVAVSATCTVTLPTPKAYKEFTIVCLTGATTVTIAAPALCTINGSASITIAVQWAGKRIKAYSSTAYLAI